MKLNYLIYVTHHNFLDRLVFQCFSCGRPFTTSHYEHRLRAASIEFILTFDITKVINYMTHNIHACMEKKKLEQVNLLRVRQKSRVYQTFMVNKFVNLSALHFPINHQNLYIHNIERV